MNHSTLQSVHMVHNLRFVGTHGRCYEPFSCSSLFERPIKIKVDVEKLPVVVIGVLLLCPSKDPDG